MNKKRLKYLNLLMTILLILYSVTGCGAAATTPSASEPATASSSTASGGLTEITATYSSEDMDGSWDASASTKITLNGSSFAVDGAGASAQGNVLTITAAGTYVFSGKLTNGQIIVDAQEKDTVHLVLNGAEISCSDNSPIYSKQAKKTILTLAEGTSNTVIDGEKHTSAADEDGPDAAIFSKDDLTINGSGSLIVQGNSNNGIGTKDDLVITGGSLNIKAVNDGLRGRDSISINGGTFTIVSGGDGLQSNNDEAADKGWISLDGGVFTITAGNDAIQAKTMLQVTEGNFTLTTGGGSINASTDSRGQAQPGWGQRQAPGAGNTTQDTGDEETASAKGLKAGTGVLIKGGVFTIDSSDDSIHANGQILVKDGEFKISSGDDGIHADSALTIDGGSITVTKSYEGLESAAININNGTIDLTSSDDGLNAAGGNDGSSLGGRPGQNNFSTDSSYYIRIADGNVSIDANGDGIDSNGALYFNGGTVLVSGPTANDNGAMDYNGTCEVTGGILAIAGSAGMAQAPGNTSTQNSLLIYYTAIQKAGTLATLNDSSGNSIVAFAPSKDYQTIVISTPKLEQGKTYTLISGGAKLTDIKIVGNVTSIADDGSQVSGGMRGMGGRGGSDGGGPGGARTPGQRPPDDPQNPAPQNDTKAGL